MEQSVKVVNLGSLAAVFPQLPRTDISDLSTTFHVHWNMECLVLQPALGTFSFLRDENLSLSQ